MPNTLTILGCGSAKPTRTNTPSSQLVEIDAKQFLVDVGEGAQITMQRIGLRTSRLDHIFISHLHGDHCFGLLGLLSTWGMTGRTRSVCLHAHPDLERLMRPLLDYFCTEMPFEIRFEAFNPNHHEVIYDDRTLTVTSLPLKHKVPCCGFLFKEKQRLPHIKGELIDVYNIPLSEVPRIKEGADFLTADGRLIPNAVLTTPAAKPLSYAYCSDTMYSERLIPWIEGVDVLYHEATYLHEDISKAKTNMHSTALQAATIAKKAGAGKLIIGHFSSRINDQRLLLEEAKTVFANTILAEEKKIYELDYSSKILSP